MFRWKKSVMIVLISSGFLFTLTAGCLGGEENESAEEVTPRSTNPTLPAIGGVGSADCDTSAQPTDQPSLDGWLAAPHSNIVGTIVSIELPDDPLIYPVDENFVEIELDSPDNCTHPHLNVPELVLTDVMTLHGEQVDTDEVRVRIRNLENTFFSLWPETDDNGEVIFDGDPDLLAPGMRIGMAMNRLDDDGSYYLGQLGLFQVVDSLIVLQEISPGIIAHMESTAHCSEILFWGAFLPRDYDGMDIDELIADIGALNVDVASVQADMPTVDRYIQGRDGFLNMAEPLKYRHYHSRCVDLDMDQDNGTEDTDQEDLEENYVDGS